MQPLKGAALTEQLNATDSSQQYASDYHSSFNSKTSGANARVAVGPKDALDIELEKHSIASIVSPEARS